jgi:hypothetical protein
VHSYCHQKIEKAIHELYNFASVREFNLSFQENSRTSTLQERLENCALELEKQERPVVQHSQICMEAITTNKSNMSKSSLNPAMLLNRILQE